MTEEERWQLEPGVRVLDDSPEVGELRGVRARGEEVEAVERVRRLADPAPRHVEAAHADLLVTKRLGQPRKEAPVLEPFESMDEHDERTRMLRHVQVAPDRQILFGTDREVHRHERRVSRAQSTWNYTFNRNRMTSPS